MYIDLKNVSKMYKTLKALDSLNFSIKKGDIISIIGPSGSGKTSLLKLVAQLEDCSTGTIQYEVPPSKKHPVILVFQDFLLFPHLTVFDNVAFGLKARKVDKHIIKKKVNEILSFFDLNDKVKVFPAQLSGGQKQRVAVARAMVVNPSVLLLDEPFANLDKNLKMDTAQFIRKTQKKYNITTICATHDLEEACIISDKVGILSKGKLIQYSTVQELYLNPGNFETAQFLGPVNIITRDMFEDFRWLNGTHLQELQQQTSVYVRAEALELSKNENGKAQVFDKHFTGHIIQYKINLNDKKISVFSLDNHFEKNDRVSLGIKHYFKL